MFYFGFDYFSLRLSRCFTFQIKLKVKSGFQIFVFVIRILVFFSLSLFVYRQLTKISILFFFLLKNSCATNEE